MTDEIYYHPFWGKILEAISVGLAGASIAIIVLTFLAIFFIAIAYLKRAHDNIINFGRPWRRTYRM